MKPRTKVVCYNYGKQGHISKYCRLKKKLRNLNLDPSIEEKINNLLIETLEEELEGRRRYPRSQTTDHFLLHSF